MENKIMKFTDLTDYQRGLIDGYVSGLKPALNINKQSQATYELKHDFESLLRLNEPNTYTYVSEELAQEILKRHGFEIKKPVGRRDYVTNINNNQYMYSTRERLRLSQNGVIVKLDWNNQQVD